MTETAFQPIVDDRVRYATGPMTHMIGHTGTIVAGEGKQTLPSGLCYVEFDGWDGNNPAVVDKANLVPAPSKHHAQTLAAITAAPPLPLDEIHEMFGFSSELSHPEWIRMALSMLPMFPADQYKDLRDDIGSGEVWFSYGPNEFYLPVESMIGRLTKMGSNT